DIFLRQERKAEPRPSGSGGFAGSEPRPSGSGWARSLTVAARPPSGPLPDGRGSGGDPPPDRRGSANLPRRGDMPGAPGHLPRPPGEAPDRHGAIRRPRGTSGFFREAYFFRIGA